MARFDPKQSLSSGRRGELGVGGVRLLEPTDPMSDWIRLDEGLGPRVLSPSGQCFQQRNRSAKPLGYSPGLTGMMGGGEKPGHDVLFQSLLLLARVPYCLNICVQTCFVFGQFLVAARALRRLCIAGTNEPSIDRSPDRCLARDGTETCMYARMIGRVQPDDVQLDDGRDRIG